MACLLLRQILYLPSRSQAVFYRVSDLEPLNDRSYRLCGDEDRAARHALLASKTFVRYVQVWMLHHTIAAPMATQAKVWLVILWRAVEIAAGLLLGAWFASYLTLKLSNAQVLTSKSYAYLQGLHISCNYILAQRCLEFWQAWQLLSSTNNSISPLRQLYKQGEWDVVLAQYVITYLSKIPNGLQVCRSFRELVLRYSHPCAHTIPGL